MSTPLFKHTPLYPELYAPLRPDAPEIFRLQDRDRLLADHWSRFHPGDSVGWFEVMCLRIAHAGSDEYDRYLDIESDYLSHHAAEDIDGSCPEGAWVPDAPDKPLGLFHGLLNGLLILTAGVGVWLVAWFLAAGMGGSH